jgi:hypothetical protein
VDINKTKGEEKLPIDMVRLDTLLGFPVDNGKLQNVWLSQKLFSWCLVLGVNCRVMIKVG